MEALRRGVHEGFMDIREELEFVSKQLGRPLGQLLRRLLERI